MGDFLTYRSIVFTILNTHPGQVTEGNGALGLVLLPRWGVSLRVFAKIYFGNKYSSYLRDHWMPQ